MKLKNAYKTLTPDQKLILFEAVSNGILKGIIDLAIKDCEREVHGLSPMGDANDFMIAYGIAQKELDVFNDLKDFLTETFSELQLLYEQKGN